MDAGKYTQTHPHTLSQTDDLRECRVASWLLCFEAENVKTTTRSGAFPWRRTVVYVLPLLFSDSYSRRVRHSRMGKRNHLHTHN